MPSMGTHASRIFSGYDPYIEVLKPTFFMVLGVQRILNIRRTQKHMGSF